LNKFKKFSNRISECNHNVILDLDQDTNYW